MPSINKAVAWACGIANDSSHGYDQEDRQGPNYDCSSLVCNALENGGFDVGGASYTGNMLDALQAHGWEQVGKWDRQAGDVLLTPGHHTALCVDGSTIVEACINENGDIMGGRSGDQTGREIYVHGYYDYPWTYCLRYQGATDSAQSAAIPDLRYRSSSDPAGKVWLPEMINHTDTGGSGDDFAGDGRPMRWLAIDMPGIYQVCTEAGGWLDGVRGYDIHDLDNGCAGDGSPIIKVRCYYETQDPASTGWLAIEYAVANANMYFFPPMRDHADTGGSDDDFAGDGGKVCAFRAHLVSI